MKFVIENISKSSGRRGHLVQQETGKQFKTPLLLQTTKGGSIPYLSREVFEYISKDAQMLQLSLATTDSMAESLTHYKGGLSAFIGFKNYPTFFMIRDPCETMSSGANDKDVVPLFTRRGKEQLTAKKYMHLMECFAPDMYQGLSDADTNLESSKKRMLKSVQRTEQFMDYCYERQQNSEKLQKSTLFAPIVGGYSTHERTESIKHSKAQGAKNCGGYFLEGFHNYGLSATTVQADKLVPVLEHCMKELESEKPRMMPGAYTPLIALELIRLGVDMLDSSYAYCAAVNFKALTFNFNLNAKHNNAVFLDLTDDCLKEDFAPLLNDCSCLACTKHTRAYVHHLYKTREILGPILLMIHNLHHYMQYFETIRICIADDKLPALIELLRYQHSEKVVDYCIYENTKEISRAGLGKGFVTA